MSDGQNQIELPTNAPVMVLRGASLFPLFIFEPRYRLMLNHALETDRVICIGTVSLDAASDDDIHSISTAGVVRASVTHDDGTSHIILQGLSRVYFNAWSQIDPFRIAEIIPVDLEELEDNSDALEKAAELIDLTTMASSNGEELNPMLHDHLRGISDPSAIADVVSHLLIQDPEHRQFLLETIGTTERLDELIRHLQKVIAKS